MKKNKGETKRNKINSYQLDKNISLLYNVFPEEKDIQVKFKQRDKLANGISHQVTVLIKPSIFMKNIMF